MSEALFHRMFDFFRRQTSNFKILLVQGIIVGGGMRDGVVNALTRQYTDVYIVALGASKFQLGLVRSFGSALRTFISLPMGSIIDKVSLRRMMLFGMTLGWISPMIYALAVNWYVAIPAVLIMSLSWPIRWTLNNIFLSDSLRDTDRATGFSVLRTAAAIPSIVMPLISALIVKAFGGINSEGIRPLFYIQFAVMIPVSAWVYRSLKEPARDKTEKPLGVLQSLKKFVIHEKGPRMWMIVGIFDSFGMLMSPFITLFAVESKGATPSIIALMGISTTLASMLFLIPFGRLADRIGRKAIIYLGLLPDAAWIFLLIYSPSPEWLMLASVFEGFWYATFPMWGTITMELIPQHLRGSYSGAYNMIRGAFSIIASTIGGILWEKIGPSAPFLTALGFETAATITFITVPETLKTDEPGRKI